MNRRFVLVPALVLVTHACTTTDPEAWVAASVDVKEKIADVGESGYQLLCSAFDGYIHDAFRSSLIVKAACTTHALRSTSDATTCTAIADECLDKLPSPVEEDVQAILAQVGCTGLGVSPTGCSSPISELIACLGDTKAALDHVALSFTCEAVLDGTVSPDWWRISPPQSCADLVTRCNH
jgi:hypothetical protein